jgi:MoaA/NifB/PqqE/SkfB family radical SAM enzyme
MRAGLDSLKFSFNSATAEQFHKVTRASPRLYDKAIENIKAVRKVRDANNYTTKLYASSIRYDGEQQRLMEDAVAGIRPSLDEHYWLPLYSFGAQAIEREKEMDWIPGAGNQGRLDAMRQPLPCWAGFKEGHITVDGKMSFCCFDADEKWIMADLKQVGFMDGWNSEAYQALRAKHLALDVHGTACADCIYGKQEIQNAYIRRKQNVS